MKFNILGVVIFLASIIVSGCSGRVVMTDVNAPQDLKNKSVIIPQSGITVTSLLRLVGNVDILGQGPIMLRGEGRIIVEKNSNVVIDNVSLDASGLTTIKDELPVYLVTIKPGTETSLLLKNSDFLIDIPYEKVGSDKPWDQPPKYWVVGIPDGGNDFSSATTVVLRDNTFLNKHAYGAGALSLRQTLPSKTPPVLKGEISGNEFYGFHGVITAAALDGFSVTRNHLVRNSFANIFVSGQNVDVSENNIYYPGNGTTGDGITVLDKFVNGRIVGNTIFVGSCYGIFLHGDEIKDVDISGNNIVNGITTAIQVESGGKKVKDVVVKNNMISGNYGFAVAFVGVEGSIIEDNNFSNNARGFPSQLYVERSPRLVVRGNLNATPLNPEWVKGHQLYRTHVNIDDSTYTLPGVQSD